MATETFNGKTEHRVFTTVDNKLLALMWTYISSMKFRKPLLLGLSCLKKCSDICCPQMTFDIHITGFMFPLKWICIQKYEVQLPCIFLVMFTSESITHTQIHSHHFVDVFCLPQGTKITKNNLTIYVKWTPVENVPYRRAENDSGKTKHLLSEVTYFRLQQAYHLNLNIWNSLHIFFKCFFFTVCSKKVLSLNYENMRMVNAFIQLQLTLCCLISSTVAASISSERVEPQKEY